MLQAVGANPGDFTLGGTVNNTGLFVDNTQLLFNGVAVGGSGNTIESGIGSGITVSAIAGGYSLATNIVAGNGVVIENLAPDTTLNLSAPLSSATGSGLNVVQATGTGTSITLNLVAGSGIEFSASGVDTSISITSDPFVGQYWIFPSQAVATSASGIIDFNGSDASNDDTCITYSGATKFFTVLKNGVYQLSLSCSINIGTAVFTQPSMYVNPTIAVAVAGSQLNQSGSFYWAGLGAFVCNTFMCATLTAGDTIQCGFQWGNAPTSGSWEFNQRQGGFGYGTSFVWQFIKPV
jgi:hypothetical protein